MNYEAQIKEWLASDPMRMEALAIASEQKLPEWCIAAGFVRNLVWDNLHGLSSATDLNDVDLIYYDPRDCSESRDREIENDLKSVSTLPWSVKNQARMHERNSDTPYISTKDAMSFWVEMETAVGAALDEGGEITIVAPFDVERLFDFTITLNSKRPKRTDFEARIKSKRWLEIWPKLVVNA
ncbi:nucleotidyltransferase family protein [Chromohalobacter nigrandesensis]|uniref:nucleotidyltransferase family protein n=1 Tax=Chromohalobacter nigrandesensis TaxID=119863 RepID=UPI001FF19A9B|nr:nucleotidyltransferase family protein [Chromohalobacter nigrandesensis]MCK0746800.1 nucleotidyltransferase family protein [Chromohalobacter nigrandesensis]